MFLFALSIIRLPSNDLFPVLLYQWGPQSPNLSLDFYYIPLLFSSRCQSDCALVRARVCVCGLARMSSSFYLYHNLKIPKGNKKI